MRNKWYFLACVWVACISYLLSVIFEAGVGESNDQKKIWKEHMEILVNFENDWSDSIDANKVQ